MVDMIRKNRNFILFSIGLILIFLSFALLFYDRYEFIKKSVFADVYLKKYNEIELENSKENEVDNDINDSFDVSVDTDYIVDEMDNGSNGNSSDKNEKPSIDYIGFLEIDKINLKVGLVSKNSKDNNVNKNVEILKSSDYPDVVNGNFILASHSGTSKISYFKHLYKLSLNDNAKVYYKDYVYYYKIVDIYEVPKVGSLKIKRNSSKTVMTLITCTKDSKTLQTVYILELFTKVRNGDNDD